VRGPPCRRWQHSRASLHVLCFRSQLLYVIVFSFRYLDIFWNFLSIYNSVMKIIFIASSIAIVYVMKYGKPHKDTYNAEDDAFPIAYLLVPALVLGVAINQVPMTTAL